MLNPHLITCQCPSSDSPRQHSPGQLSNAEIHKKPTQLSTPPAAREALGLPLNSVAQKASAGLCKFSLREGYSHCLNRACFSPRATSLDINIDSWSFNHFN